jgi:hypothetical protein
MGEPEYQSLINGKLKGEFGLPNASQKVNDVIDIWTKNVRITANPITISGSKIKGGFKLDMIDSSYNDVLANDGAIVIDGTSGVVLPWLEWLLLYGNKIIVRNYVENAFANNDFNDRHNEVVKHIYNNIYNPEITSKEFANQALNKFACYKEFRHP